MTLVAAAMATATLFVPLAKHGALMGKDGLHVKALQADFNVVVRVPRKEQASPQIVLTGTEADIARATAKIKELIGMDVNTEPFETTVIAIPSVKHGALIGKGGETLKEIQKKSQALIDIPKKDLNSDEITVTGTKAAVKIAIEELQKAAGLTADVRSTRVAEVAGSGAVAKLPLHGDIAETLFFDGVEPQDSLAFTRFITYLRSAKVSLDVCVFSITDDEITRALLEAHKSGVKVRIISDDEQSVAAGSDIAELHAAGVPVRLDHSASHMHHKFVILDGKVLINGSFNWTRQGHTANRENIIIASSKPFVAAFAAQFEKLWTEFAKNPVKFSARDDKK